jgi:hypothetical protein
VNRIRESNDAHTKRCATNLNAIIDARKGTGHLTAGECAMIETAAAQLRLLYDDVNELLTRTEKMEQALREIAGLIGCDKDGRDAQTIAREALEKGE